MENWHELKEQVDSIDRDLKVLKEMVVEIRTAIRGNHLNPNGYGPMIDEHEKRLQYLENKSRENKTAETIFKIGGGATVGAMAVKIIESFLK